MNTPPFLLGATLVFWGWQVGLLWVGAIVAALLEGARWIQARWDFSQEDLDRVWNLSMVLFLGAAVFAFASGDGMGMFGEYLNANSPAKRISALNKSGRVALQLLQWLPLPFLPMVAAQAFATRPHMDWSTFSWWLRRRRAAGASDPTSRAKNINISYAYYSLCLLAASASNQREGWFVPGLAVLLGWGLWACRPRAHSPWGWAAALGCAAALGLPIQAGFSTLQKLFQQLDSAILSRLSRSGDADFKESRTAMGSIGLVKLSGRIVMRIESEESTPPGLLREASFNLFRSHIWVASGRKFNSILSETDEGTWVLLPNQPARRVMTMARSMSGGAGVLALPRGTVRLEQLPVFILETNRFGTVRSSAGPGFVRFQAWHGDGPSLEDGPGEDDLVLPPEETPALDRVAEELGLSNASPEESLSRISAFFAKHFVYAIWRGKAHLPRRNRTALESFLFEHRSGHCEYFATATTLLLRRAGIPARYVVGYAVEEQKGKYYVVRERHAHAWAQAWIHGAWREVDNTPGTWVAAEANRAPFWEPLRDALSRIAFEFSKWRWGKGEWKRYLLWFLWPLLFLAMARLLWNRPWRRAHPAQLAPLHAEPWPGLDSEFYRIEQELVGQGLDRHSGETLASWLNRLREDGHQNGGKPMRVLEPILAWHYRLRFDPRGLNPEERGQMKRAVEEWLETSKA